MSSDYLESMNCRKELREALNVNKLSSLIVLRVDSVSKEDFPNMGLINKVDMVCLSPVGYGV